MSSYLKEVGVALSHLLNAATGGSSKVPFSASSADLALHGRTKAGRLLGRVRMTVVDWVLRDPQHCRRSLDWHSRPRLRPLINLDRARRKARE